MSKVWTLIVTMTGIVLLLKLAGIPTGMDYLLNMVGLGNNNATSINVSTFYIAIIALFALTTTATVIIGLFVKSAFDYVFVAGFASGTLILWVSTFISVINYASGFDSWIYYLVFTIFGIMGVGFLLAVVDYVFNRP